MKTFALWAGLSGLALAPGCQNITPQAVANAAQPSILGKAVIVQAQPDDLKTQPIGNAGGRVAWSVIESAKAN